MSEINKEQQQKALELRDSLTDKFNEKEASEFINEHKNTSWYEDFLLLYDLITSKDYEITIKTKAIIAGTLGICDTSDRCYTRFFTYHRLA